MSKKDCKLTVQRLHQVLDYNKETGVFVWKHRDTHKEKLGQRAEIKTTHGYLQITIDNSVYYAHRLAFLYVNNTWPNVIDHINGEKTDNRIINIRSVSQKTNIENVRKVRKHNSNKLLGVYASKDKFQSKISVNGTCIYLGRFQTKEEAHEVFLQAKRKYHNGCTI